MTSPCTSMPCGPIGIEWLAGTSDGSQVQQSSKKLGQLHGVFSDQVAWLSMDPETVVYRVQWWEPVPQGTPGGLFWGVTTIEAGCVNAEYFMTQGHFHAIRNRGEYYGTVKGGGVLVLMSEDRSFRTEVMSPGSLHYIPACTAHRVVNTSDSPLVFWAAWPSDAGHDYETIRAEGFSVRVLRQEGAPALIPEPAAASSPTAQSASGSM